MQPVMISFININQVNSGYMPKTGSFLDRTIDKSGLSKGTPGGSGRSLTYLIASIIKTLLGFLGIIFIILIIYAGFLWMTAAGNEDKVTKAKATLFRGIIGLFIIVAAYVITAFVFKALAGIIGNPT